LEGQQTMKPGETSTVIGRSAKFRGDLSGSDELLIDGEFEGTIHLTGGRVTVGADAKVRASIFAPEVVVFGRVEGDIRSTGRVDLRSTAVVLGDVFATRFSIEENAALRGHVDPSLANEVVPAAAAAPVVAKLVAAPVAVPVAPRPVVAPAAAVINTPRNPDLFHPQTGSPLTSSRQMPSALAAIAAAGLQDPSTDDDDEHTADEGVS
jgi:cytoskeletal protein CcmA (bactofilin family)